MLRSGTTLRVIVRDVDDDWLSVFVARILLVRVSLIVGFRRDCERREEIVHEGDAAPLTGGDAVPLTEGVAVPLTESDAVPLTEGDAVSVAVLVSVRRFHDASPFCKLIGSEYSGPKQQ